VIGVGEIVEERVGSVVSLMIVKEADWKLHLGRIGKMQLTGCICCCIASNGRVRHKGYG